MGFLPAALEQGQQRGEIAPLPLDLMLKVVMASF